MSVLFRARIFRMSRIRAFLRSMSWTRQGNICEEWNLLFDGLFLMFIRSYRVSNLMISRLIRFQYLPLQKLLFLDQALVEIEIETKPYPLIACTTFPHNA